MNRRKILEARLKMIENLYYPAWASGDLKVYLHYSDLWMHEFNAYYAGTGRYA